MKMLKAIAIDDEPLALRVIVSHTEKIPFVDLVFTTTRAVDAIEYIQTHQPDIIFLDMQMPDITGFEFIRLLKGNVKIILTTAYHNYAADSYNYDVLDYLLKPISFERLLQACQKASRQLKADNQLLANTEDREPGEQKGGTLTDCIFIKTDYKLQKIMLEDILYIDGGKDYVTIVTKEKNFMTLASLTKIQQHLPCPQFIRVHKSCIVALNKIDMIERMVIHIGGETIRVGETYKEGLLNWVARI
jgi:DNA-binding LytR/AlgR family response regulator